MKADLSGAIANLRYDLEDRFDARVPWSLVARHPESGPGERAEDVAAIRGYIRAIRVLEAERARDEDDAIAAEYPCSEGP